MPSHKAAPGRRRAPHPSARRKRWIVTAVIAALAALAIADRLVFVVGRDQPQDDWQRYDQRVFLVANVVDGDTIDLDVADQIQRRRHTRVRLWGVDTPEAPRDDRPGMHYAEQATAFTNRLVLDKSVEVKLHPGKKTRGKYGRLLAYIHLPQSGEVLNELLVKTGHAYADRRFDHRHMSHYKWLERQAEKQRRGLWTDAMPEQWPAWRQRMVKVKD